MAIIGAHQMRLRSSAHPSHVLDGFHRHGGILAFSTQQSAFSTQRSALSVQHLVPETVSWKQREKLQRGGTEQAEEGRKNWGVISFLFFGLPLSSISRFFVVFRKWSNLGLN
jgi:hypothetical protein